MITEYYPSERVTVSLVLKAGSRFETIKTSGVSRLMGNLFLRGTQKLNREQLESKLNEIGADVELDVDRELVTLSLTVAKNDASAAIDLVGQMVFETKCDDN